MGYQIGTQEQLDAAKDDARLLPFDTAFVAKKADENPEGYHVGSLFVRGLPKSFSVTPDDDESCAAFRTVDDSTFFYVDVNDLEPINDK